MKKVLTALALAALAAGDPIGAPVSISHEGGVNFIDPAPGAGAGTA